MNLHEPSATTSDSPLQLRSEEKTTWRTIKRLILSTVLLLATAMAVERVTGGVGLFLDKKYDQVSADQLRDRQQIYTAALPVQLAPVSPDEITNAVGSMELSSEQQQVLLTELQQRNVTSGTSSSAAVQTNDNLKPVSVQDNGKPLQLAWITLWDTDTEDADTVRITSEGYSRIVTLANHPVTFAVPIPTTGIMNVTGIHDGGGGITVGITSGSTHVGLPIMSEGQVIGVPIAIR